VLRALPAGAVFYPSEPVFSLTGPSAIVSWLEPLLLQLHYRIQVATLARFEPEKLAAAGLGLTCEEQKGIFLETLDQVKVKAPPVTVDTAAFVQRVRETARGVLAAVGDPLRVFEVGLRSVSCPEQHEIALRALQEEGITRTSNVHLARKLGLVPVGTMGHEHIQRFRSDAAAFRAMRDRRPQRSSYLLDTFNTLASGLPAAYALIAEEPNRGDSIRFDSGDKAAQARWAIARAREQGLRPSLILEDGLDAEATVELEKLRVELNWPENGWFYGYGGYFVSKTAGTPYTRDRVAAVWKLSQSGPFATMKFGDEAGHGKESQPGQPVVFRRVSGAGPIGLIGQADEPVPPGYVLLSGAERDVAPVEPGGTVARSPVTQRIAEALRHEYFGRSTS
jgi:nicotinic acid phosphoribosyltransferase